jgi:hypothetical protein
MVGPRLDGHDDPGDPATVTVLADGRLEIEAGVLTSDADNRLRVTFIGSVSA